MKKMSENRTQDIESVLLSEEALSHRVKELAEEISRDYDGKELILVCILKGAVVFFTDLARRITVPLQFDFLSASSYGSGHETSGTVRIKKDLESDIAGKHVLIVEDIMDSGVTLFHLKPMLLQRNPASLKIACLLDKPERRQRDISPDYCGFTVPDAFVVGYGLDYANEYRNLPYIGILKESVYK